MNGTTIFLLVFLIATNLYWFFFTEKILRGWKESSEKWAEITDELIEDVQNATAEIEATTKRLQEGDHT